MTKIEVVPLPENFLNEANRIKSTRTGPPLVERAERSPEDRNRVSRPRSRKPNFGSAGAPKTNRARRRASGR
jgi:ATP-dependent RNA helicase RhlE